MNAKKILALLLALMMLFALAVGCKAKTDDKKDDVEDGSGDVNPPDGSEDVSDEWTLEQRPEEFVTLKIFYPGDYADRFEEYVNGDYNAMLERDLNMNIEMEFAPWGDYWTKEEVLLAAQTPIDFFWDGLQSVGNHASKGYIQPLDELVAKYGYGIRKAMPQEFIDTGKIGGVLYGIPGAKSPMANGYKMPTYRQDVADAIGMAEPPRTPEEFTQYFTDSKALGYKGPANSPVIDFRRYYDFVDGNSEVTAVAQNTYVKEQTDRKSTRLNSSH